MIPPACVIHPERLEAFRFQAGDHCRLALLGDPSTLTDGAGGGPTLMLEIHDPCDQVPPHRHARSVELYFVLRGQGRFNVAGRQLVARTGDSVVVPPGALHGFENPGPDRLYLLTLVSLDDGFAASLRRGLPTPLDEEDLRVLRSL